MAKAKKKSYSKVLREKGNKRVKKLGKQSVNVFAGKTLLTEKEKKRVRKKVS